MVGRGEVTGDCSYFPCLASACFAEDSLAIMKREISTNGKLIIHNLAIALTCVAWFILMLQVLDVVKPINKPVKYIDGISLFCNRLRMNLTCVLIPDKYFWLLKLPINGISIILMMSAGGGCFSLDN